MCKKVHEGGECEGCEECQAQLALPQLVVLSDAVVGFTDNGDYELSEEIRRDALAKVRSGETTDLEFEACTFLARYPNTNYLRFKEEDLAKFAASYKGAPFLRNHDVYDIGARDGTIVASRC